MWVQMNETQERLYTYIAENPGVRHTKLWDYARWFRKNSGFYDHLDVMTHGQPYGNITLTPRMICRVEVDGWDCYWAILGPFIPEWMRERRATEVEKQRVEALVLSWTG